MNRSERIRAATNTIRSVVECRAKWMEVTIPGGLQMSTRYAVLDSRALHEIREQLDSLMEESRKMERKP